MSFVSESAVTVTTNATALCTAKTSRKAILISNNDASAVLYIGASSGVTTSTGTPIPAGQSFSDSGEYCYTGIWYGIVASSTLNARVLDQYLLQANGIPV